MTSVFDVLAHEDSDGFRNTRRATVAARARVEETYGAWIRQDPTSRVAHVVDDIKGIVAQATEEYGVTDQATNITQAIYVGYLPPVQSKTASIEVEAGRMPRMCPFHKDVTDISLNSGDPSAGFSAMAQHWGGPRHCEGEGYEGDSCKFKPQMTTQSYWDERAEKMEQRKQERAEREEQEAIQQAEQAEAEAEFNEPLEQETEVTDNVVELRPEPVADSTEVSETSATPDAEIPMSMAASAKVAGPGIPIRDDAWRTEQWGRETGKTPCISCGFPNQPGAPVCQKCHAPNPDWEGADMDDAMRGERARLFAKTADKDTTGLGGPVPTMDKSKWSPKEPTDIDDPNGRHPTKRKDIVDPVKVQNNDIRHPGNYDEIGKQVTERQDVTQDSGVKKTDQGGTFTGGPKSAISAVDVDRNPIIDMMNGDYDGFTPEAEVQRAIVAHKRRV